MTFDEWVDRYRPGLSDRSRNLARAVVNEEAVGPTQGTLCPYRKFRGGIGCTCRLPLGHPGHHDLVSNRW